MKRLGWFLLFLFFFPSSSKPLLLLLPFQTPLQNSPVLDLKEDRNDRNRGVVETGLNKIGFEEERRRVRLQGHAGGHGVGGHGGYGGGGGGVMSHHNNDNDNRHVRGANSCTTNHIGFLHLVFLVLPFLFLM